MRNTGKLFGALAVLALAAGSAFAQNWPTKPVKVIVGLPPGSSTDIASRAIAERLSAQTGQIFVVEIPGGRTFHPLDEPGRVATEIESAFVAAQASFPFET